MAGTRACIDDTTGSFHFEFNTVCRFGEEESKEATVAVAGVGVQCVNMNIN